MSRSPGSIDDRKKQAVLSATLQLRVDHGDRFSISQVARRAGVSRQTIYNQFGDRTGLLHAFAEAARVPCPICPPLSGPLEAELAAYAERLLRWSHDPRRAATLGLGRGPSSGRHGPDDLMSDGVDAAVGVLSERLKQVTPRVGSAAAGPPLAARLFLDLVLGDARRAHLHGLCPDPPENEIARQARTVATLFVRGYAAAQGDVACAPTPEEKSP